MKGLAKVFFDLDLVWCDLVVKTQLSPLSNQKIRSEHHFMVNKQYAICVFFSGRIYTWVLML